MLSVSPTLTDPHHYAPSARAASRLRIGVQVCSAIAAFAAAGLVHNDVKPENLFLRRAAAAAAIDGVWNHDDVALGDAGAARGIAQPLAGGTAAIVGTLPYTAPEVAGAAAAGARIAASPAADVYSAGVTLLLLGVKMFPWQLPGADTRRWVMQVRSHLCALGCACCCVSACTCQRRQHCMYALFPSACCVVQRPGRWGALQECINHLTDTDVCMKAPPDCSWSRGISGS